MLFWMSWVQPGDDYRPLSWPPPEAVVAYWCSGQGSGYATLVALVRAEDPAAARAVIQAEDLWPDAGAERFCREFDESKPPGDRFPPPEWSVEMGRWPWPTTEAVS